MKEPLPGNLPEVTFFFRNKSKEQNKIIDFYSLQNRRFRLGQRSSLYLFGERAKKKKKKRKSKINHKCRGHSWNRKCTHFSEVEKKDWGHFEVGKKEVDSPSQ